LLWGKDDSLVCISYVCVLGRSKCEVLPPISETSGTLECKGQVLNSNIKQQRPRVTMPAVSMCWRLHKASQCLDQFSYMSSSSAQSESNVLWPQNNVQRLNHPKWQETKWWISVESAYQCFPSVVKYLK
jgi:hypothetical protein